MFGSVPLVDDQISVKVNESGWAWMVCGERLIIWKISQTAVAKVRVNILKLNLFPPILFVLFGCYLPHATVLLLVGTNEQFEDVTVSCHLLEETLTAS